LLVYLLLSAAVAGGEVPVPRATLIAHYPLQSDGLDATGNNGPMILFNAPFKDGGVYCNGIYPGGDPDAAEIRTPTLEGLDPESFTASAEFCFLPATSGHDEALI